VMEVQWVGCGLRLEGFLERLILEWKMVAVWNGDDMKDFIW